MADLGPATPEAAQDPEAGSVVGDEVPDIPGPRNFVILQEDDSFDLGYSVGSLDLDVVEGDRTCEVAAIAVIEGKLLVAVPEAVWSKAVQKRKLAGRALTKPHLVAVAACLEDSRESESDIVTQLRVWVGFLHPELERNLEFLGATPPDFPFGEHGGHHTVPFAPALVEVANEQFNFFMTAESAAQATVPDEEAGARLDHLEAMMRDMKTGLDSLLGKATGGATVLPSARPAAKKNPGGNGGGQPSAGNGVAGFRGLDPATVENALQAGIPEAHLREVGKIMRERPKRLEEVPRQRRGAVTGPLSETEEEAEIVPELAEEGPGGDGGLGSSNSVERAILELTKIAGRLSANKSKKEQLEALLDGVGAGSAAGGEGSSSGGKRNAAALRALTKCLKENPKYIYQVIESNLQSDFESRPVQPGEPLSAGTTVRGWLTAKSRIQNYQSHVRWVWQVAGVWDALIGGRQDEARARCALLVGAADQASIDQGSWLISSVSLLEAPPPYQQFANHVAPTLQESQHTVLYDHRWLDLFLSHLKEVDSYVEAKKRLGGKSNALRPSVQEMEAIPQIPGQSQSPRASRKARKGVPPIRRNDGRRDWWGESTGWASSS